MENEKMREKEGDVRRNADSCGKTLLKKDHDPKTRRCCIVRGFSGKQHPIDLDICPRAQIRLLVGFVQLQ